MLTLSRLGIGLLVSVGLGGLSQHFLMQRAWTYAKKKEPKLGEQPAQVLTIPVGALERALYTLALSFGAFSWVGIWLGLKVAASWNRWRNAEPASTNAWLLGNGMAVMWGLLGAWIALGGFARFQ